MTGAKVGSASVRFYSIGEKGKGSTLKKPKNLFLVEDFLRVFKSDSENVTTRGWRWEVRHTFSISSRLRDRRKS